MSANTDTVLQANFKTPAGTLINVYANTPDQFDQALEFLTGRIDRIASVESVLTGASHVGQQIPVTPVVQAPPAYVPQPGAAPQQWAPVDPGPPPAPAWGPPTTAPQQYGTVPTCAHGQRVAKSGSSAKGPWRAYMCPTPKGTVGQCEPQWIKPGTPEWAGFPA